MIPFQCLCLLVFFPDKPYPTEPMETVPALLWEVPELRPVDDRGALVLNAQLRFEKNHIHHYRLIRVYREGGKPLADVLFPKEGLLRLKGQVITRSGTRILFDKESAVEVLQFRKGEREARYYHMIPQGVTGDCLVEIFAIQKAEYGLPVEQFSSYYPVAEPYYVARKTFFFSNQLSESTDSTWSDSIFPMVTRLIWEGSEDRGRFSQKVFDDYIMLDFRKVPALLDHAFSLLSEKPDLNWVQVFRTLPYERIQSKTFWNDTIKRMQLETQYRFYQKNNTKYLKWLTSLKALPREDVTRWIQEIHARFKQKITAVDLLTPEELVRTHPKRKERLTFDYDMMIQAFARGYVFRDNLAMLLFKVYRDLGFKAKLVFAPMHADHPFSPRDMNALALDFMHPLIGFRLDRDRWFFVAPAYPEYASGTVPEHYRDQHLLLVDPDRGWLAEFMRLPPNPWKKNQLQYQYKLAVREDGLVNFSTQISPRGNTAAKFGNAFYSLTQTQKNEWLWGYWEAILPQAAIFDTAVEGRNEFDSPLKLKVRGGFHLEAANPGGDRFHLAPFPGMEPALAFPRKWYEGRDVPIRLEECTARIAKATVVLPTGWRLADDHSWRRENELGQVSFQINENGQTLEILCKMVIAVNTLPAEKEPLLRIFLRWLEEAQHQMVTLIKPKESR